MDKLRIKLSTQEARELAILRLVATAVDLRKQITRFEIQRAPSLAAAFVALDAVWHEMGWDSASEAPPHEPTKKRR